MTSYAHHNGDTLVVGNHWLERQFAAQPGKPFHTTVFLNKISDRDYARAGGREFCFSVNGSRFLCSTTGKYASINASPLDLENSNNCCAVHFPAGFK